VAGAVALGHIRTLLRNHPNPHSEPSLQHLYRIHIHPALPILPTGKTEDSPPLLLTAIIASALSHSKETRSLAAPVAGLLSVGGIALAENNLAGVASAVLELGMRPVNNSWSSYLVLSKVSQCCLRSLISDYSSGSASRHAHQSTAMGDPNVGEGATDPSLVVSRCT
jgi:hypothetical protein